jgi:hypothetical protein
LLFKSRLRRLNETDWREEQTGTHVPIFGEWYPVLPQHYIIRGKSPDWNVPHACINKKCEPGLCHEKTEMPSVEACLAQAEAFGL